MKKKICIIFIVIVTVFTVMGIVARKIIPRIVVKRNVTYIGHSDGPTAIFLAGKIGRGPGFFNTPLSLAKAAISRFRKKWLLNAHTTLPPSF